MEKHYRFRKVTPRIKEKMKELREEGLSYKEIGKRLLMCGSTIAYHLSEEQRKKAIKRANKHNRGISKEERKKINKERYKYKKEYLSERYRNDPEFRDRFKKMVGDSFKKRREKWLKKGLCSKCGKKRKDKTFKTCERCRERERRRK